MYNIGALIARRLEFNGEKGPTFGGIFTSLFIEHLRLPIRDDDLPLPFSRLDIDAMKRHEFITRSSHWGNLNCVMIFDDNTDRTVLLPAPILFDYNVSSGWSLTKVEQDEYLVQQQFHAPAEDAEAQEDEHQALAPPAPDTSQMYL